MHDLGKPLTAPHFDRELVAEFLMAFSRFEYALKRAGYAKQRGHVLTVEWRRFVQENAGAVAASASEFQTPDARYVSENLPRKQVMDRHGLRFEPQEPTPVEVGPEWLLEMAYRVRNNLFHGGKWAAVDEAARNDRLLRGSLDILRGVLRFHPQVEGYYFETLD